MPRPARNMSHRSRFAMALIHEFPQAPAAAQPLHPRRRRRWPSPLSPPPPAPPAAQQQPPPPQQPSTSRQKPVPRPLQEVKFEAVDSDEEVEAAFPSSSRLRLVPNDVVDTLSPAPSSPYVGGSVASPEAFLFVSAGPSVAPSPAASSPLVPPRRLLPPCRLTDIKEYVNAGSEEDSELGSDDEEDFVALAGGMMPRVDRDFAHEGHVVANESLASPSPSDEEEAGGGDLAGPEMDVEMREESPLRELVGEMGPVDMYSFDWVTMGPDYVADLGRKEKFAPPRQVGSIRHFADAYDAFTAIWDRDIMGHICTQTNEYAQEHAEKMMRTGLMEPNSRISKWVPTSIDELYLLFAIDIAMGILQKGSLEEYWNVSKDMFETPGFRAVMSRNRYTLLKRCLHFSSNLTSLENLTQPQVKLLKIQPILDHLNERFRSLYVPDVDIALDESLTQWRGKLSINQFIRNKAAGNGIKSYEVCESRTGYLHKFEVHAGHENLSDDPSPVTGIIPSLVLRLLSDLENRGHTVWMDNFYNSPALARSLKSKGFDCVGTLRTDRKFVPMELKDLKKNNMPKGGVVGVTSGDVDIVVWCDKNSVALISTYHGNVVSMCHTGDFKPNVVLDYNLRMGGVDKKDQMLAAFPMERKRTKIWYKKFFRKLVNVSILNAYILCMSSSPSLGVTQRQFRKQLCEQLLARHLVTPPPRPQPGLVLRPSFLPQSSRNHFPEQLKVKNARNKIKPRLCNFCKKRTTTFCPGCDVALCSLTCFRPYHS